MNIYSSSKMLFKRVNDIKNKDIEKQKRRQKFWVYRANENMKNGRYDIGYEYLAMLELLCVKTMDKSDNFRLKMWRMFVIDFRRAFSQHEFERFQKTLK